MCVKRNGFTSAFLWFNGLTMIEVEARKMGHQPTNGLPTVDDVPTPGMAQWPNSEKGSSRINKAYRTS